MGLILAKEQWKDFYKDFYPIWITEHRKEVQPKEVVEGRINSDAYQLWEEMKLLDVFTARLEVSRKLVGYFVAVTMPYVNFTDVLCGMVMLYYVRKQHRFLGIGSQILAFVEQSLRTERNVDCIWISAKTDLPFGPFFQKFGWKPHETLMLKWY